MASVTDVLGVSPTVGHPTNVSCANVSSSAALLSSCTSFHQLSMQTLGSIPTYLSIFSCTMSCLGSLLIFISYFTLKGIRNVAQKIITLLALADFFTASGYLLADWNYLKNSPHNCDTFETICEVQSFITSWSSLCSFGWTCSLALHFFLLLGTKNRRQLAPSTLLVWENVLIWIPPLFIIFPLLVAGKLGYSPYATSNWCFIRNENLNVGLDVKEIAFILVGGKLWEMLSYVFVIVMYAVTVIKLRRQLHRYVKHNTRRHEEQQPIFPSTHATMHTQKSPQEEARSEIQQRLLLIPVLFIFLRMWGTIQFIYSLASKGRTTVRNGCVSQANVFFVLGLAQAIGDGGQGWGNALLYIFLSPTVRRQLLFQPLLNLFSCCLDWLCVSTNAATDNTTPPDTTSSSRTSTRTSPHRPVVVARGEDRSNREAGDVRLTITSNFSSSREDQRRNTAGVSGSTGRT